MANGKDMEKLQLLLATKGRVTPNLSVAGLLDIKWGQSDYSEIVIIKVNYLERSNNQQEQS